MSDPSTTADRTVDVLIVGGGAAGLTSALQLGELGVDFLLAEKHADTSILPKAHILNPITMEIFDRLGIADEVYALGTPNESFSLATWHTSLGGDEPWDNKLFYQCDTWGGGDLARVYATSTPYRFGNLNQKLLEPVLRRHVDERSPGQALFSHEVTDFGQDEDGVWGKIVDLATGTTFTARAKFLIGADGGRTVGPKLGIELAGPDPFVDMISVHFRADMSSYFTDDRSLHRLFVQPQLDGTFILSDIVAMGPTTWGRHSEEWHLLITLPTDAVAERESYDEQHAIDDVRRYLKIQDLELDVLQISHWLIRSAVAERYQDGRIFLVGDAAHRHSPNGGIGMNTGIQDVANLTWKLAAVLRGQAGPRLLDSYGAERRPVGVRNVEWATFHFFNYMSATAGFNLVPGAPDEWNREALTALFSGDFRGEIRRAFLSDYYQTLQWEWGEADVELGFEYADSPAVVPDGTLAPSRCPHGRKHVPVARPGHRVPHAWLRRGDATAEISTHHLIRSDGYTLFVGADGDGWRAAAESASAELGVPIDVHTITTEGHTADVQGMWLASRGHDDQGAVLVRPDSHVVYRATSGVDDEPQALRSALSVALASV